MQTKALRFAPHTIILIGILAVALAAAAAFGSRELSNRNSVPTIGNLSKTGQLTMHAPPYAVQECHAMKNGSMTEAEKEAFRDCVQRIGQTRRAEAKAAKEARAARKAEARQSRSASRRARR